MRLAPVMVLLAAGLGCGSGVETSYPTSPPAEQSVQVRSVVEARVVAQRYLHEHNLENRTSLSEGRRSVSEGWSFLVDFNESLIVGHHFFLRILPNGTVIRTGGA